MTSCSAVTGAVADYLSFILFYLFYYFAHLEMYALLLFPDREILR